MQVERKVLQNEKELELRIQQPSQELFIEMLRTLPLQPVYGYVDFVADSVSLPKHKDENDLKNYLSKCSEHGIMPFSNVRLEHAGRTYETRCWRTKTSFDPVVQYRTFTQLDLDIGNKSIDALVLGGRFHQIRVDVDDDVEMFEPFKTQLMKTLLQAGYAVWKGDLWLTTYHLTGYSQGDYRDSGLDFAMDGFGRGAELKIGNLSEEEAHKVKSWFRELAKKQQ